MKAGITASERDLVRCSQGCPSLACYARGAAFCSCTSLHLVLVEFFFHVVLQKGNKQNKTPVRFEMLRFQSVSNVTVDTGFSGRVNSALVSSAQNVKKPVPRRIPLEGFICLSRLSYSPGK